MNNNLRILHLEDNPADAELVRETLTAEGIECEIACVETREDFLAAVEKGGFKLILADYALPSFDGLSALVLARERCPDVPFIFVSGTMGEEAAIESLKKGATDYVLKGRLLRLASAVRRALNEAEERIERKRAEETLKESEERYRSLFENANDGIFILDLEGNFIDVNRTACERLGYTKDEMLSIDIKELVPPEFASRLPERLARIQKDGHAVFESAHYRKDRTIMPVEVNSRIMHYGGQKVYFSFARDITERNKSEEALKESEERYRLLVSNIPAVTWIADREGGTIFISSAVKRIYGFSPEEIYKNRDGLWFGRIHPDDLEKVKSAYAALFTNAGPFNVEYRIKHKDESWIWIHDTAFATFSKGGKQFAYGVFSDITEQKKAEDVLRKYEHIVSSSHDHMSFLDNNFVYQAVNDIYLTAWNKRREDIIGHHVSELLGDEIFEKISRPKLERCLGGEAIHYQAWFEFPVLGRRYMDVVYSPYFSKEKTVEGIVVNSRDITELNRANEAFQKSEGKYRTLIDEMNEGVFVMDKKGSFTFANNALAHIHGLEKSDDLIGRNFMEFAPADYKKKQLQEFRTNIENNQSPGMMEIPIIKAGGSRAYIQLQPQLIIENGRATGVRGVVRDVTERKQAEDEINILKTLSLSVSEAEDFPSALMIAIKKICEVTGWVFGELWMTNRGETALEFGETWCSTEEEAERFAEFSRKFHFKSGEGLPGRILATRKPEWLMDVSVDGEIYPRAEGAMLAGLKSGFGVPIIVDDKIPAVICFYMKEYREEDKRLVELISAISVQLSSIFQRKLAEDALRKSESSLIEAQRIAHLGNWDWDLVKNELKWSDEVYHIFGLKSSEFGETYEAFLNFVHPGDREFVKNSVDKTLYGKTPYSIDHRIVLPDATERIVHEQAEVVFDETGKPIRMVGTVLDVTEQKHAEETIERNYQIQNILNALLNVSLEGIPLKELLVKALDIILSVPFLPLMPKGGIFVVEDEPEVLMLTANRGFSVPIQELCARVRFGMCLCGRAAANREIQFADCLDDRHENRYDGIMQHGHYNVPILSKEKVLGVLVLYLSEGHKKKSQEIEFLQAVADTLAGIIERKRAEEGLKQHSKELLSLAEASNVVLTIATTTTTLYDTICDVAVRIIGLKMAWLGLIEEGSFDVKPVAHAGFEEGFLSSVKNTWDNLPTGIGPCGMSIKTRRPYILTVDHPDFAQWREEARKRNYAAILGVPLIFTSGKCIGALLCYSESSGYFIQDRVKILQVFGNQAATAIENRWLIEGLENKVKERTSELETAKLQTEAGSRSKSEFLANMSHELRTPLNAVIGLSQVLLERTFGPLNDKQSEYLDGVRQSGNHLLELINEILDLSKIEAGKEQFEPAVFSMPETLRNAFMLVKEKAMKHGIELVQELGPEVGLFTADERRVKQILFNLLSNAVKFTQPGGKVGLKVGQDERALTITVWDTGIGIPEDKRNLIFQPFQQLDSLLSRKHEGTGLGLVLTKRFVEMHRGTITFESREGGGTSFTVTLPVLGTEKTGAPQGIKEFGAVRQSEGSVPHGKKIMVVEDNRLNMLLVTDFLKAKAFAVVEAVNGEIALDKAAKEMPDIILLDIQMSGIDGFEVIRRLRENVALKGIPVIAMTALAMKGDKERCLRAGCNDYISKPVNLDELLSKIDRGLGREGQK